MSNENTSRDQGVPEQIRIRTQKRADLLAEGIDPYPVELPVTATIKQVRDDFSGLEPGEETDTYVGVAGRVVFSRNTGRLCFAAIQDGQGRKLQVMLSQGAVGKESLDKYKAMVDLGDILFAYGRVIASKRGELSVFATGDEEEGIPAWVLGAKALRPLPKVFETKSGQVELAEDTRVRRRYLDLIMRPAAREMVRDRAEVIHSLRTFLHDRGFIEIETPMLQAVAGGAAARPFKTHMNAYDMDLYLRIAPELYLKRAVVGGIEKVFEINRNFRNEGADSSHNPEFTMVEVYEAYGNYHTMADLTRGMIQQAAIDTFGSLQVTLADGSEYDFAGDWKKISLYGSLSEALGEEVGPETSRERLLELADKYEEPIQDHYVNGKIAEILFEKLVGDHLYEPTFVMDFPADTSPLTRVHRSNPLLAEKWDLYIRGFELATAYSEQTDPVVQREKFGEQALAAAKGDPEAMSLDEDFLEAMDYGMPPSGGMGMGLDRLLMAFTGEGIRETILFPLVKPLEN